MNSDPPTKNKELNIVILDDNFVLRQVLNIIFKRLSKRLGIDLKIYTSSNGLEGLGYVYLSNPDVVLIDTTLPKYSGKELFDFLVSNQKFAQKNVFVGILDQGDRNVKLPQNFSVIDKSRKHFLTDLIKRIFANHGIEVTKSQLSFIDRYLLKRSDAAAYWANKTDLVQKQIEDSFFIFKFYFYFKWILVNAFTSIYLTSVYFFSPRPKDNNVDQIKLDKLNYRARYYPTLALTFVTVILFFIQITTFFAGSLTFINIKIENFLAAGNKSTEINLANAEYDPELITINGGKVQLKSLVTPLPTEEPVITPEPTAEVTITNIPTAAPTISDTTVEPSPTQVPTDGEVAGLSTEGGLYTTSKPQIIFKDGIEYSELISIIETSNLNSSSTSQNNPTSGATFANFDSNSITYQISPNLNSWYFYNGLDWVTTEAGYYASNTIQEINKHLAEYPQQEGVVFLKAFLHSDGNTQISLEKLEVNVSIDLIEIIDETPSVPTPVVIPVNIEQLMSGVTPVILNASWINGEKIVSGRVDLPRGVTLFEEDLSRLRINIFYTDSKNPKRKAADRDKKIGQAPLVKTQYGYLFEARFPEQPGGYVTADLVYLDLDGKTVLLRSNFANPKENSTFTVDGEGDQADLVAGDGVCDWDNTTIGAQCSLRAAIQEANALAGTDNIYFNISGFSPYYTIQPATALPTITSVVNIDGTTQGSSSCNPMSLQVELNGSVAGTSTVDGLVLSTGTGSTIKGLVINEFRHAVFITSNSDDNDVQCNIIGLAPDGTTLKQNFMQGVYINLGSDANTIGGALEANRNVLAGSLSGNSSGIVFVQNSNNTTIQNNYIGTTLDGLTLRRNTNYAISLSNAHNSSILNNIVTGGTSPAAELFLSSSDNAVVQGNCFGTDATCNSTLIQTIDSDPAVFIGGDTDNLLFGGYDNSQRNVVGGRPFEINNVAGGTMSDPQIINNFFNLGIDGITPLNSVWTYLRVWKSSSVIIPNMLIEGNYFVGYDTNSQCRLYVDGTVPNTGSVTNLVITQNHWNYDVNETRIGGCNSDSNSAIYLNSIVNGATVSFNYLNDQSINVRSLNTQVTGNELVYSRYGITANFENTLVSSNIINNTVNDGITVAQLGESNIGITQNTVINSGGDGIVIKNPAYAYLQQNSVFNNGGLGIDLNDDGVTENDAGDADSAANNSQNFPVLTYFVTDGTDVDIYGSLNSNANTYYEIEFFSSQSADASGYGEGQEYLGSTIVQTDGNGDYSFSGTPVSIAYPGFDKTRAITATATACTSSDCSTLVETSEFSNAAGAYVIEVNSTGDAVDNSAGDGLCDTGAEISPGVPECTLRAAIQEANAAAGADDITFDIGAGGYQRITVGTELPTITESVFIDGTTQPGASCDPLSLAVEIYGPNSGNGLTVGAADVTIKGMNINHFNNGIFVNSTSTDTTIQCNIIGLDHNGDAIVGNTGRAIQLDQNNGAQIGGVNPEDRNVLSGNSHGIYTTSFNTFNITVQGNYIGTDVTGTQARGNTVFGIELRAGNLQDINTLIGGTEGTTPDGPCTGACNIISNNAASGMFSTGTPSAGLTIQGNYIGVDVTGTQDMGNGEYGIYANRHLGVLIGGELPSGEPDPNARNVISGNGRDGIFYYQRTSTSEIIGNYIGTNSAGTAAIPNGWNGINFNPTTTAISGNVIKSNLISGNGIYGIQFANSGSNVTLNTIEDNIIGRNFDNTANLPNTLRGVYLLNSSSNVIQNNYISGNGNDGIYFGGSNSALNTVSGNIISGNGANGIYISNNANLNNIFFNSITNNNKGVVVADSGSVSNRISTNTIYNNASLGIDLNNDNITNNDLNDADTGPNNLQNFPILNLYAFTGTHVNVYGTFNSLANTYFQLQFFANTEPDASGLGEGETYLGETIVQTDGSGNYDFSATPLAIATASFDISKTVSATATRCTASDCNSLLDTSEFSNNVSTAPITVNTVDNDSDINPGDGACNTGQEISPGIPECTLRAAIQETNAFAGADRVEFNIDGGGLQQIIVPNGDDLPAITESLEIDATTQPGAACPPSATLIEVSGAAGTGNGINIQADNVYILGLTVNNFANGVAISNSSNIYFYCNIVGLDNTGTVDASGNTEGIYISGSHDIEIGAEGKNLYNVISGNTTGISIIDSGRVNIHSNYIGTNTTGDADLGNGTGIYLNPGITDTINIGGTSGVTPGDSCTGVCNLISGNNTYGIYLGGTTGTFNAVDVNIQGNYIGTDITGSSAIANGKGIYVRGMGNVNIGGITPEERNIISGSSTEGVYIHNQTGYVGNGDNTDVIGNYVGTNDTGTAAIPNSIGIRINGQNFTMQNALIAENVVSGNSGIGISVGGRFSNTIVRSNFVGVSEDGLQSIPNTGVAGISAGSTIAGASITIGGNSPEDGNLVANNTQRGISVTSTTVVANVRNNIIANNTLQGLYVDSANSTYASNEAYGNQYGIYLSFNANANLFNEDNYIHDNDNEGVYSATGFNNTYTNNRFMNNGGHGIILSGGYYNTISSNTLTGNNGAGIYTSSAFGNTIFENVITENIGDGIWKNLYQNHIYRNSIYNNGGLGIDSGTNGVNANDAGDPDSATIAANQNYPILEGLYEQNGELLLYGNLNSLNNTYYKLEFFSNTLVDPTGHGEGQTYLDSMIVQTNGSGNYRFLENPISISGLDPGHEYLSVTATKCNSADCTATPTTMNTSEFSNNVKLLSLELLYPINNALLTNISTINYDWNLNGQVEGYESTIAYYQVYRDGELVITTANTNTEAEENVSYLDNGSHTWYVEGYNADDILLVRSTEETFSISLATPTQTPTSTPSPTLTPTASPTLAASATPTTAVTSTVTPTPTISITPTAEITPTTSPGEDYSFRLIYPVNVTIDTTTPFFDWTEIQAESGADRYDIYIDDQLIFKDLGVNQTYFRLQEANRLSLGEHSWFVTAKNGSAIVYQTTAARFRIRMPVLPNTGGVEEPVVAVTPGQRPTRPTPTPVDTPPVVTASILLPVALAGAGILFTYPNTVLYALGWIRFGRKGLVWGKVYDKKTHQPVPFSKILIFKHDKLVSKAATAPDGTYRGPFDVGNYWVTAQNSLYEPGGIEVKIKKDTKEIDGDIYLAPLYHKFKLSHYRMQFLRFKISKNLILINGVIFTIAFVYSLLVTARYPTAFNIGIVLLYLVQLLYFSQVVNRIKLRLTKKR